MRCEPRLRKAASLGLLAAGMLAGCGGSDGDNQTAAQAARQALQIKESDGAQKSVETRRDLEVIKTTEVVDKKTGQVVSTEKEVTPVTVQKTREVQTQVQEGKTTKTVK